MTLESLETTLKNDASAVGNELHAGLLKVGALFTGLLSAGSGELAKLGPALTVLATTLEADFQKLTPAEQAVLASAAEVFAKLPTVQALLAPVLAKIALVTAAT